MLGPKQAKVHETYFVCQIKIIFFIVLGMYNFASNIITARVYTRVANVVADHDDLLTE